MEVVFDGVDSNAEEKKNKTVRLKAGGTSRDVADPVLPPHGSTVGHLHLQTCGERRAD